MLLAISRMLARYPLLGMWELGKYGSGKIAVICFRHSTKASLHTSTPLCKRKKKKKKKKKFYEMVMQCWAVQGAPGEKKKKILEQKSLFRLHVSFWRLAKAPFYSSSWMDNQSLVFTGNSYKQSTWDLEQMSLGRVELALSRSHYFLFYFQFKHSD